MELILVETNICTTSSSKTKLNHVAGAKETCPVLMNFSVSCTVENFKLICQIVTVHGELDERSARIRQRVVSTVQLAYNWQCPSIP